jgi:hypothetical protein
LFPVVALAGCREKIATARFFCKETTSESGSLGIPNAYRRAVDRKTTHWKSNMLAISPTPHEPHDSPSSGQ